MVEVVFETHATTEDNEAGIATDWLPGRLSARGQAQAQELGRRRRDDRLAAVLTSDLARARETAALAFGATTFPILADWRLRECDYGQLNGAAAQQVHAQRQARLIAPYPGGESWRQATDRATRVLGDLHPRWAGQRVLVIGHLATRWAFDCALAGQRLEDLVDADFNWREGWEYRLDVTAG